MKRKPWVLVILAFGHFLAPLGNLLVNALWSGMAMSYYLRVSFQPQNIEKNWPQWVFPVIAGCAIYICKRWSFFIYMVSICSLFVSSYLGYRERVGTGLGYEFVLVCAFNIAFVGYFLIPAVRQIYFDPRLRWWEADDRYRADLPAKLISKSKEYAAEIGNFSIGGLFLKAQHQPDDKEIIDISFDFSGQQYRFTGEVIRHGNQATLGFGVKFVHHDDSRNSAKLLAKALAADKRLLSSRLPSEEDSFLFWLKRLLTTGKGLMPEKKEYNDKK